MTDGADVDGACVGLIDGNFVGNIDGTGDGTNDGKCVGEGVGTDDGAAVAAIVPPVRNVGSRHQVLRRLEAGCAPRQPQPHPRRRVAEPDEVVAQPLLPPPADGRAPLEEAARLAKSHHVTCARRHERQEQLDVVEGDIARRTQRELKERLRVKLPLATHAEAEEAHRQQQLRRNQH